MRSFRWSLLAFLVGSGWYTAQPQASNLAPTNQIQVTTTVDDTNPSNQTCSLREAVLAATSDQAVDACSAGAAVDQILLPAGVYRLTNIGRDDDQGLTGDLDLRGSLQITGVSSATTIIDGNVTDRVLDLHEGRLTLEHVEIRNGYILNNDDTATYYGHGIFQRSGNLSLDHVRVIHNGIITSPILYGLANYGGGVASLAGMLSIQHSFFNDNEVRTIFMGGVGVGGGLYIKQSTVSIANTIFEADTAGTGMAIANDGGNLTLSQSQIRLAIGQGEQGAAVDTIKGMTLIETSEFQQNQPRAVKINQGAEAEIINSLFGQNGGVGNFYCASGGAIANAGRILISDSRFIDNYADQGGALVQSQGSSEIYRSEFSANRSNGVNRLRENCHASGAAISQQAGTMLLDTSTLAFNDSRGLGGALDQRGVTSVLTLTNSTVVSNTNRFVTGIGGAGVSISGTLALNNSMIANNWHTPSQTANDCLGNLTSQGHNLLERPTAQCQLLNQQASDLLNLDPLLGEFALHGGSSRSFSLTAASPALDAGPADCGLVDQRLYPRPVDGNNDQTVRCDIGAFEAGMIAQTQYFSFLPFALAGVR
ncbi:MAG TPA: CSLREA domain-containing protein [Herpetosiphon sp.]|uniref:CSLREA domain-containing protein n=1 Tax=Herpetosiphon aurantiacus (strain ATCC 23779 / DSM 785 / 114-95) TaxID=316274 RepID=A9B6W0_HERA2|nr:CSLREA domain-containing protein [Herpetosiphon sp.]ABX05828.1 hypothetical protein Haur_3191 [Herpetosiphon aurantiacus DSM 785]HBW48755.1 CSLREA domain-containing protein [Herpetosiphon sp.]